LSEARTERKAKSIAGRESLARLPPHGGPLGVVGGHRLDPQVEAEEQRSRQAPIASMSKDLLGDLRPVGGPSDGPGTKCLLNQRSAVFALQEGQYRRCIHHGHG